MRDHEPVKTTQYLTDEFSDEAVAFIERHKKEPFFLYLSYNAPHGPLQATEEYLARFSHIKDEKRRTYAAMVSALDDGVIRVLDQLEREGITENTLVFFLSDNGGCGPSWGSSNGELNGRKGEVWEGGYRVPFAFQWKGEIPQGMVYDQPVSALDIYATIAEFAQVEAKKPLDGVNIVPYLKGEKEGAPHEALYTRIYDYQSYAVRSGHWKLRVGGGEMPPELYDLSLDIGEKEDLAQEKEAKVQELLELKRAWDQELIEPTFEGLRHRKKKK